MAGIYIHIPFCSSKCRYCDFFSRVVNSSQAKQEYVDALCGEIILRKDYFGTKIIKTIYFGGGTPSVLSISQIEQILKTIEQNFIIDQKNEITLEANPDDLTIEYLNTLKQKTSVNRLSVGVQSFSDANLKLMNRKHSAKDAISAIENAQKIGFENITIDLIFSLPEMTEQNLRDNLNIFFDLNIPHLSAYNLIIEDGTVFGLWKKQGKIKEQDDEKSLNQYKVLMEEMEKHGYLHYEISNFAKPEFIAVHNFSYWTAEKYLGIGASAHSFDGKARQWNIANIQKYITGINNSNPEIEQEILSETEKYNEFILTGLRTFIGINIKQLENEFSEYYLQVKNQIDEYLQKGLMFEKDKYLILSKEGKFISDSIMSDLMIV